MATLLQPPPHCEPTLVDDIVAVRTDDAKDMAWRLIGAEIISTSRAPKLIRGMVIPRSHEMAISV